MNKNNMKESLLSKDSNSTSKNNSSIKLENIQKLDEEIAPLRRTGQLPDFKLDNPQEETIPERRTGNLTNFKLEIPNEEIVPERRTGNLTNFKLEIPNETELPPEGKLEEIKTIKDTPLINSESYKSTKNSKKASINKFKKSEEQDLLEDYLNGKIETEIEIEELEEEKKDKINILGDSLNTKSEKRKQYSLSNPRQSMLQRLSSVRKLKFFARCFRNFERGSLRAVVLLWIRMTMGVGILTLPALMEVFGMLGGIVCLLIGFLMCLMSYRFIFEAAITTDITDYSEIVRHYMPGFIYKVFRITYFIDMISFGVVYSVFGYKLLGYLLYSVNLMKDEWMVNEDTLEFDEYNPTLFLLRSCYFVILYVVLVPLLLKKNLEKLKIISFIFMVIIILLAVIIMIEAPFFRNYYVSNNLLEVVYTFKEFKLSWIPSLFSLVLAFYVQPFVLTLRKQLLSPSEKRLKKVATLSVGIELFLYIIFSCICYGSFGDKFTSSLIILRKPYDGKNVISEYIFKIVIFLFFFITNIGLCVYNPGTRDYLAKFFKFGGNKRRAHIVLSLIPFLAIFLFAVLIPDILSLFWIIGLVFCNFNGFIIPAMMKVCVLKQNKAPMYKIIGVYTMITFYITCGIVGVSQKAFNF